MTFTPQALREWARGSLPCEAATELLLRAFNGRFAQAGWPWMHSDEQGRSWVDFEAIPENIDGLSGGEHRFLMIAASLGGDEQVALSDVVPGLDRALLDLVLAALAHAAGSHQDSVILEKPEGVLGFERVDTLYPWPKDAPALRVIDGGQN
jgi:hypothetical protein